MTKDTEHGFDWRDALARIDAFVAVHPEIDVSPTGLGIPHELRSAFYALLAEARKALTAEVVEDTGFATRSVQALKDARYELEEALDLEGLILPTALQAFCDDVYLGSSQAFLDKVLSYVQGRLDASALYAEAALVLPQAFRQLEIAAYEAWLAYSSILMLEPTAVFTTELLDETRASLVPARQLELGYQAYSATLRLPEAVFSTGSGKVAFKFELVSEIDFYNSKPKRRRDFSSGGDSHGVIGRRFSLFYRVGDAETVPILADRERGILISPDRVFGTLCARDLGIESYCQATLVRIEALAPRQDAVFSVLDLALKDAARLTQRPGAPSLQLLEAGFDTAPLKPFIDTLTIAA
jgi:hypothetical protein